MPRRARGLTDNRGLRKSWEGSASGIWSCHWPGVCRSGSLWVGRLRTNRGPRDGIRAVWAGDSSSVRPRKSAVPVCAPPWPLRAGNHRSPAFPKRLRASIGSGRQARTVGPGQCARGLRSDLNPDCAPSALIDIRKATDWYAGRSAVAVPRKPFPTARLRSVVYWACDDWA